MPATNFLGQRILEAILAQQAIEFGQVYAGLFTTPPTVVGGGVEVSGNGYSRVALVAQAPTDKTSVNGVSVVFPPASASWGVIEAIGVFTALTGGNLLMWDQSISVAVGVGQTFALDPGDMTTTVS